MSDYNRLNVVNGVTKANATNMNIIDKGVEQTQQEHLTIIQLVVLQMLLR